MNPPRIDAIRRQDGVMLLEALLAILIFSVGILAIVGMQGSAVNAVSDAKYRSDASMLADQLVGQMWASDRTPATLQTNFQGGVTTDGPTYTAWVNDPNGGVRALLPGVAANPPQVTVDGSGVVTIQIFWSPPSDLTNATRNYILMTQIN